MSKTSDRFFSASQSSVKRLFLSGLFTLLSAGLLHGCGGGASTQSNPVTTTTGLVTSSSYTGPNAQTDDVRAFQINVWERLRDSSRCGACHIAGGQSPEFVRQDDVNLAYAVANPLIDLDNPGNSRLVTKVGGGHNCWLPSAAACATAITSYIEDWAAGASGGGRQIQLIAPVAKVPGQTKTFPNDGVSAEYAAALASFGANVWPLLTDNCAGCHVDTSPTPQAPFFASGVVADAYVAAQSKINLNDPSLSRLVIRLRDEFHNCWTQCSSDATEMQNAIATLSGAIAVNQVQAPTVFSNALTLQDGVSAAGGNRYENDVIALYEFRTGSGNTILDLSGVTPELNLTMSGAVDWVGGFGIRINGPDGKAQGSTANSKKLHDLIKLTGEYSIEAWVVPANVVQEGPARIVSYSASTNARNFTLGQTQYNYDFLHRSSTTDANGEAALSTADAAERLQATLQHVVVTFDPINGRRIYVNGAFTGDMDSAAPGNLNDWDDSFALVLGNEVSNNRLWEGVIRLVAIHNRALTLEQIQQNFAAGVGEKFFLLFGVGGVGGVPANSYIMFEVEQFDSYSYLFTKPTFINLDPNFTPGGIAIQGMRIGINSKLADVGQAYANLNVSVNAGSYDPATGQQLADVGTVIALENGPNASNADEFYLTFETLGTANNVVVENPNTTPVPLPDPGAVSQIGLRTFDEINATMAAMTGVDPAAVQASFTTMRQALPAVETIEGFLAAQQMSITQLAVEYCNALVQDTGLRNAFFATAVVAPTNFDFNAPVGTAFTGGKANVIVDDLYDKMIGLPGTGADLSDAPSRAEIQEVLVDGYMGVNLANQPIAVPSLFDTLNSGCPTCDTRTVVQGLCSAVLGSAAMLVQ
jgi:hypothetical protein